MRVLLVEGSPDVALVAQARREGFTAFLKPASISDLLQAVEA